MADTTVDAADGATVQMQGTRLTIKIAEPPDGRKIGDIEINVIASGGGNRDGASDVAIEVIQIGPGNRSVEPMTVSFVATNGGT